jgi:hypothetical protein
MSMPDTLFPLANVSERNSTIGEEQAIEIWLARWLKVPRRELLARYGCDPRRIYEIWEGRRFIGSREKALKRLAELHWDLASSLDTSLHRRFPKSGAAPSQLALFDALDNIGGKPRRR